MPSPTLSSTLEQLRDFDTALLANTLDFCDPTPAHDRYLANSIRSATPTLGPTVGIAVTCELDSSSPRGKPNIDGYWRQLEEMSRMDVPVIWVVKCVGSRPQHECVMGDGMAKTLQSVGCVGVVTDGGVRDLNSIQAIGFAAYCAGITIHHTPLRFRRINQPIRIGGITVRTGDILHANVEGVIRIPRASLATLPQKAIEMQAFEHEAHLLLRRRDVSVADKRTGMQRIIAKYRLNQPPPGRDTRR